MKTFFNVLIFSLFSTLAFSQTVNINVDYGTTGNCPVCGTLDFACSNGFGGWNNGKAYFNDPVPAGNVVTAIEATVYYVSGNVQASLYLDNEFQGSISLGNNGMACGGCLLSTVNMSGTFSSYVYGGSNELQVLAINVNGWICVDRIELEISYEPVCDISVDAGANQTVYFGYPPAATATLTATVTGGDDPIAIYWYDALNNPVGSGTPITVSPETTTTYLVEVIDANECVATDYVTVCVVDVRCGNNNNKVQLCHSDGSPAHTICVGQSAVADHLAHGDQLGSCEEQPGPCEDLFWGGQQPVYVVNDGGGSEQPENEATEVMSFRQTGNSAVAMSGEGIRAGQYGLAVLENPFSEKATIQFTYFDDEEASVRVFDLNGKVVAELFHGSVIANEAQRLTFDASQLPSGIYFCQLQAGGYHENMKLVKAANLKP
jgi:Secretion system C-terminal sorting domain